MNARRQGGRRQGDHSIDQRNRVANIHSIDLELHGAARGSGRTWCTGNHICDERHILAGSDGAGRTDQVHGCGCLLNNQRRCGQFPNPIIAIVCKVDITSAIGGDRIRTIQQGR